MRACGCGGVAELESGIDDRLDPARGDQRQDLRLDGAGDGALSATERARNVEPVWVSRLNIRRRKSIVARGEDWTAICTMRPSTAAAS